MVSWRASIQPITVFRLRPSRHISTVQPIPVWMVNSDREIKTAHTLIASRRRPNSNAVYRMLILANKVPWPAFEASGLEQRSQMLTHEQINGLFDGAYHIKPPSHSNKLAVKAARPQIKSTIPAHCCLEFKRLPAAKVRQHRVTARAQRALRQGWSMSPNCSPRSLKIKGQKHSAKAPASRTSVRLPWADNTKNRARG